MLALLALSLAVAGCSYGRSGASRHVTPPDPPPVPRAKPIAAPVSDPRASQQASAGGTALPAATNRRVHAVTEGQSLYAIARFYDVSMPDLIAANGLAPPYTLAVGDRLVVPHPTDGMGGAPAPAPAPADQAADQAADGVPEPAAPRPAPAPTHVVESGDTVYSIARRYQVDMTTLMTLNSIPDSFFISPGQRLALPGGPGSGTDLAEKLSGEGTKLGSAATAQQPAARATDAAWTPSGQSAPAAALMPPPEVLGPIPDAPPRASDKFLWPVDGELVLNYGPKQGGLHNDGINIAAPRGSPVFAAENGVVAYVGNELRGFGNLLLIKHDGDWMTAYAHNEEILVGRGARVEQGQTVARVGDSGSVVTPQLHFEIRRGTRAVDPATLMSPRQSAQSM